uniref:Uncharacterized protein n=1 Tax=Brassica oleracea var. oleracea TaxID=109376 RepID=A0A0D2ZPK6_BRAOL
MATTAVGEIPSSNNLRLQNLVEPQLEITKMESCLITLSAKARSLHSDRTLARARSLRIARAEHAFGRCVATLFELLSDDSRFLCKAFRKKESISKDYSSKKVFFVFFYGLSDIDFVVTDFDPNRG